MISISSYLKSDLSQTLHMILSVRFGFLGIVDMKDGN